MASQSTTDQTDNPVQLTVLFADVADSTRLYQELGNRRALEKVERCMSRLDKITREQGGDVIKTVGDEIMCKFATPEDAVIAATRMQQERLDPSDSVPLKLRIGLQHGDIIERYGDVFGDTVNVASRLTSIAKPGQILTTVETMSQLPASMREAARQHERVVLKGIAREVIVSEVLWKQDDALTMMGDAQLSPETRPATLKLTGPDGDVIVGDDLDIITLGRDPGCTVRINHPKASRNHARIEQRVDKFVLIDSSTNGTWVCFDSQSPFRLRLEQAVLRGSGSISFGEAPGSPTAQAMRFEVA
jgi:class 3 adenylate cyclase